MSFHDVRLLYFRELRGALRETNIVINSLLLPILLYPLLLWVMFSAISFAQGQEERFVSRVAFDGLQAEHAALAQGLEEDEQVERVDAATLAGDPAAAVRAGELDAHVRLLPATAGATEIPGNFRLEVTYDASKDRSVKARQRVEEAVEEYREAWVERAASERRIAADEWDVFRIVRSDTSSGGERGAFILGLMAPMMMVIMVAVGCFYPAVDATAGEHERSTWETTITLGASRASVLVAKFLYVATLGTVAGLLNLASLTLSMRGIIASAFGDKAEGLSFHLPWQVLPLVVAVTFLLALFIAAGMMLFAVFARTFKEGQSMIGPFYMLVILPTLLVQSPDLELTAAFALVPIANVVLLFRELIAGDIRWAMIGLVLVAEAVTVVLLLWAARWVLSFEDVMAGSYGGSLGKLIKQRVGSRRRAAGEARS